MDLPSVGRIAVRIKGTVQGVGFRPFVYSLSRRNGLSGFVRNQGGDVYIEAQGPKSALIRFLDEVRTWAPPLSKIESMDVEEMTPLPGAISQGFVVVESRKAAGGEPGISPDVSMCEDCRRELNDPRNRRYLYPFINCTNCGPRFTIVEDTPYDRERTSMKVFTMCGDCSSEYKDPDDRRFHAEPNACWECGPHITVTMGPGGHTFSDARSAIWSKTVAHRRNGPRPYRLKRLQSCSRLGSSSRTAESPPGSPANNVSAGSSSQKVVSVTVDPSGHTFVDARAQDGHGPCCFEASPKLCPPSLETWIFQAQEALLAGEILAIKGVGGFHLACDALNDCAVQELRARKRRPNRPFAILVRDLELAKEWFLLSPKEEELLKSQSSPIVIVKAKSGCQVALSVAPGLDHLGIMLPYSPMHALLFHRLPGNGCPEPPKALVMTSGNATGLPLDYKEDKAVEHLGPIADMFLLHNRPIVRPCDDSVVRVAAEETLFYRRSRGYVPSDFPVPVVGRGVCDHGLDVFGAGAEGKNVFCLLRDGRARMSQHVGDLHNEESLARYKETVTDFAKLYRFSPYLLAVDAHPAYQVTRAARQAFPGVPAVAVQHHHAHLVAVMAESGITEPCAGIILDGTGYGTDGTIWGGEVLVGDYREFRRYAHLKNVQLPGGEVAALEPWRMAVAYLQSVFGGNGLAVSREFMPGLSSKVERLYPALSHNTYLMTSSAGRLFDAVAALCGICQTSTYDGEAAALLGEEALRDDGRLPGPRFTSDDFISVKGSLEIDSSYLIRWVVDRVRKGRPVREISYGFHDSLSRVLSHMACVAAQEAGITHVALSGGVFQNPLFLSLTVKYISEMGLRPLWHKILPPNDGGIALGQALVAVSQRQGR